MGWGGGAVRAQDNGSARHLRAFVLGLTKLCRHTALPQCRRVETAISPVRAHAKLKGGGNKDGSKGEERGMMEKNDGKLTLMDTREGKEGTKTGKHSPLLFNLNIWWWLWGLGWGACGGGRLQMSVQLYKVAKTELEQPDPVKVSSQSAYLRPSESHNDEVKKGKKSASAVTRQSANWCVNMCVRTCVCVCVCPYLNTCLYLRPKKHKIFVQM